LFLYVWGLVWFVARWIAERILDSIGSKVRPRHVIGGIAFGLGAPGFSLGAWALWIIFRYEVPVAFGLVGKYPQGVMVYLGSQLLVWSVAVIAGVLLVGLGIVAFFPDSPHSEWIARHFPVLKQILSRRKQRDRISHFP